MQKTKMIITRNGKEIFITEMIILGVICMLCFCLTIRC
jgi:hypothetical protein